MIEDVSFVSEAGEAAGLKPPVVLLAPPLPRMARLDLHRRLVAAVAGLPPDMIPLPADANGAPLPIARAGGELFLSRSASGGCTALAVARERVGIDVACEDGGPLPFAALSLPERQDLGACADETQRRRLFLRIWAAKEAYLKALGTGLLRDPASVSILRADATRPRVLDVLEPEAGLRAGLRVWEHGGPAGLPAGAVLCLCRIG